MIFVRHHICIHSSRDIIIIIIIITTISGFQCSSPPTSFCSRTVVPSVCIMKLRFCRSKSECERLVFHSLQLSQFWPSCTPSLCTNESLYFQHFPSFIVEFSTSSRAVNRDAIRDFRIDCSSQGTTHCTHTVCTSDTLGKTNKQKKEKAGAGLPLSCQFSRC